MINKYYIGYDKLDTVSLCLKSKVILCEKTLPIDVLFIKSKSLNKDYIGCDKLDIVSLIFSFIGTVVGIIGLFISIKTLKNTANIKKSIISEKIKVIYPNKHKEFVSSIDVCISSLHDCGQKYYIIEDLIKTCKSIKAFYDNWDDNQKSLIDDFLKYLEEIPNQDIDDETRKKILNELYEIHPQLERIGELNDIR